LADGSTKDCSLVWADAGCSMLLAGFGDGWIRADGWIDGIARGWIVGLVDGWIDGTGSEDWIDGCVDSGIGADDWIAGCVDSWICGTEWDGWDEWE